MKRISVLSSLTLAGLVLSQSIASAQADPKATAAAAQAVLKRFCHRCHNGPGSQGGEFDILQPAQLTAPRGLDKPYVSPGKPDESGLFRRMEKGLKLGPGSMPPRKEDLRPTEPDVAAVRAWIQAGAPAFAETTARKFVSLLDVLTAIRDHLRATRAKDRVYLRYFTFTNLHNNPKVSDADLLLYRAALSKAVNSLSLKPRVVLPLPVDHDQTVYVIDVRDLDWDRHNLWQEVLRLYPYGLEYGTHPDRNLQKLDEDIRDLSDCDLPMVRGDWFTATATRPPLYHILLQLPTHARDLEHKLGVHIDKNFLKDKLARAGFAKSGVSAQNRLLERHDANTGGYWKSYDFKPDNGRSSLTRFPLGPLNLFPEKQHPFRQQAFVHDGGEIIFNLPNGLQGYLLVDGKDNRIDTGPIEVVNDPLNTSGTPAIVTGVSCMACHKHGMIPFKDYLNAGSAVFGDAEQKVKELYKDDKAMAVLVEQDERRFMEALEKTIGPVLRVGADKDRPLKDFAEPVGEVARLYRLGYLDLKTVALELDVEKPEQLLIKLGEKKLKELGLEGLLKEGGLISRLEWEAIDGISHMQRVARELRATPVRIIIKSR